MLKYGLCGMSPFVWKSWKTWKCQRIDWKSRKCQGKCLIKENCLLLTIHVWGYAPAFSRPWRADLYHLFKDFWRPFVKWFALCYRTIVLSVCRVFQSVCNVGVLWPNGWMDQDKSQHGGRPRPRPQCVRWHPSSPPKKGTATPPIFGPYLLWPNSWMDQDATCYGGRPLSRRHCVIWGPSSPPG